MNKHFKTLLGMVELGLACFAVMVISLSISFEAFRIAMTIMVFGSVFVGIVDLILTYKKRRKKGDRS